MPTQLAPTSGTMGYGLPAAVAAAIRFKDRPVVCVAGDGDFLMNGQELATAAQYGADLLVILVDNGSYGTIRMHQEREYPERISRDRTEKPRFRRAGPRLSAAGPKRSTRPRISRPRSTRRLKHKGIRLIHCRTDVEQISNATTIAKLARAQRLVRIFVEQRAIVRRAAVAKTRLRQKFLFRQRIAKLEDGEAPSCSSRLSRSLKLPLDCGAAASFASSLERNARRRSRFELMPLQPRAAPL